MKKLFFCCLILFTSSIFAQKYQISNNNQALFENRTNWVLSTVGESHTIQNVSGKVLRLDLMVDKFIAGSNNVASDGIYVLCGQKVQQVAPDTGLVCDIPYPGVAMIVAHPFVNGASGQFSLYF